MGARQLETRFPAAPDVVDYIPFWEPDAQTLELLHARGGEFLYTPMSRQKHLYILQDIKRLATKHGYRLAWPVDVKPWWDLPHLAYLQARRLGRGHAFFWAAYRARWERGEDICSDEVIRRLAAEVGLDAGILATAPADAEVRALGAEALLRCYRDGVFGIPFFCLGREKFWGVDRFEDFAAGLSALVGRPNTGVAPAAPAQRPQAVAVTGHA
jgi:2-hydroxychromene-2-carboxylate isomerase